MLFRLFTAVIVTITVTALVPSPASAKIFGDAPDILVCPLKAVPGRPGGKIVLYIDGRFTDGTLLYKPQGKTSVTVTVTPKGVVSARNMTECDGKTLRKLRDEGRAFDFR